MNADRLVPGRAVRELGVLAFAGPALLLDGVGAGGWAGAVVVVASAALVLLLGRWGDATGRLAQLPIALVGCAVPAALSGGGLAATLLAAVTGTGIIGWMALRSGAPASPRRRAMAVAFPAASGAVTLAFAVSAPGISAGPGAAALLVVGALVVLALLVGAWPGGAGLPPGTTDPSG